MERLLRARTEIVLLARLIFGLMFVLFLCETDANAALSSYTFSSTTGVTLDDTLSSTQLIGTSSNNSAVSPVTLIGFTFTFNGVAYTQFSVNENGLMRLGATAVATGTNTDGNLTANANLPKITAYYDDLSTTTGTVRYKLTGVAPNRKLMVQWNVSILGAPSTNSKFQVWLYETSNNIAFVYGQNMVANAGQYSAGLVAAVVTDYQSINTATNTSSTVTVTNTNTSAISSGRAYLFSGPGCVTAPSPAASATNVVLTPTLSWSAGTGSPTGYDVYFGTSSTPPIVSTNQAGTTYAPPALIANTTYYWKVNPRNSLLTANCTPIQFTTAAAPGCVTNPSPAANATGVPIAGTTLSWTPGTGNTTGYNVFFGTAPSPPSVSPNQAGTTYNTGALITGTVYYWKIVPINNGVQNTLCTTVYQFTAAVAPGCPTIVSPTAGATNVSYYNTTLNWTPNGTTATYDVFFGTSNNPPQVSTDQVGTSYVAGNLTPNTKYYWKLRAKNGASLPSPVCNLDSFTTAQLISYDVARSTGIAFTSISSTGNTVASWKNGGNTDDNLSNSVPIGFNFNYGGRTFSNFLVSTNGFITFNTSTSSLGGSSTPYGYTDEALSNYYANASTLVVAPFYYDMVCQGNTNLPPGLGQSIHYSVAGAVGSRVLTVEWSGMELYSTAGPDLNFQVKLYETSNNIEFVYGTMEGYNGTVNVGYNYSVGINGNVISSPPISGEVINQLTANTRNFGLAATNSLNAIPDCNSKLTFTQGAYTAFVPGSAIPANDASVNAIPLTVNSSPCIDLCGALYTSMGATSSGVASSCAATTPDDDVWFKFTVGVNTNITIKVLSSGNYDGTIELFNNAIATPSLACGNSTGAGLTESITTNLTSGQQYYVRVYHRFGNYGAPSSSGQFSLCVYATPPPPSNDACANKINLTVTLNPVFIAGTSTYSATPSAGIPACSVGGTNPDDDVWYSFTAVNTTEVVTVVGGTGFDAVIQVFGGTCGALVPLACVDALHNGQTETVTINNLTRNAVYLVRVYHEGVGGGTGNYTIAVTSPPPACVQAMAPSNGDMNIPAFGTDLYWDSVPGADNYRIILDTVFPPTHVLGVTTDFTMPSGPLLGGKTYYWRVETGNATGFNSGCQVFNFQTELTPINVTLRVFLEGFYVGNQTMLPLVNPLDTITDTITISLADSSQNIVFSQNIYLGIHGWATAHFPVGAFEEYWYLVINQRNSLEIWSDTMFGIFGTDTTYDFSTSSSKAFGGNQKLLGPGVYGMHIGDLNQDGAIDPFDMVTLQEDAVLLTYQNQLGDVNGDWLTESVDCSILENKFPLGLLVQIPFW